MAGSNEAVTNLVVNCLCNEQISAGRSAVLDWIGLVIQFLGSIGTIAAAWVAVHLARKQSTRDKLTVEPILSNEPLHYTIKEGEASTSSKRGVIWIGVKNMSPESSVSGCHIYVDAIYQNKGKTNQPKFELLHMDHPRRLEWSGASCNEDDGVSLSKGVPRYACIAEISSTVTTYMVSNDGERNIHSEDSSRLVPKIYVKFGVRKEGDKCIHDNPQDVMIHFYITGVNLDCTPGYARIVWKGTSSDEISEGRRDLVEAKIVPNPEAEATIR